MFWHLHKYSRWRSFTYVSARREVIGGLPVWREIREPMQEKICKRCCKTKQRKV